MDGINYPITGGNFIDLCSKSFYTDSPVSVVTVDTGTRGERGEFSVLAGEAEGESAQSSAKQRRIPLEILREDSGRKRCMP